MNGAIAGIIGALLVSRLAPKNRGPGKPNVPFTAAVWSILVPIGLVLFAGVLAESVRAVRRRRCRCRRRRATRGGARRPPDARSL